MSDASDKDSNMQHVTLHKPKKAWYKRVWVWILAILLTLFLPHLFGHSNSSNTAASNTATSSSNASSSSKEAAAPTPKINEAANDGKFQFTVTGFSCGHAQLENDNQFETATAHGQFCVLKLTVKGIGDQSQQFNDSEQYIYSDTGTQYSTSSDGTIAANPSGTSDSCYSYPTINPGVSLSCNLAFDVPKGVTPTYATLHDSSMSGGVKVNLQ